MNAILEDQIRAEPATPPNVSGENRNEEVPLADLVGLMAQREASPGLGEDAFKEFHRRYYHRLNAMARKWESLEPWCDLEVIINETLLRFYKQASHFVCPPGSDPETINKLISTWLFRTLERQIFDFHRQQMANQDTTKAIYKLYGRPEEKQPKPRSRSKSKAKPASPKKLEMLAVLTRLKQLRESGHWSEFSREFHSALSEDDLKILEAGLWHINAHSGRWEIHPDELAWHCGHLNISETALRVRRSRLITKLKHFIQTVVVHPPKPLTKEEEQAKKAQAAFARKGIFLFKYHVGRHILESEKRNAMHPNAVPPWVIKRFSRPQNG
jgi:DNA-directed RNA polymerase specialized sigma24 family protein